MADKYILSADVAHKKLQRMAYEILEKNAGEAKIILAGIKENGVIIAHIIESFLKNILIKFDLILPIKIRPVPCILRCGYLSLSGRRY